ncbi:dTDP-4-dehydrorhamnose 3,5-epimerase [Pelagibacterales bacterium]|nr:dTDP-4-dehydrorhamnose 3,5-epimerase [Pelagibacterales bacterium]
MTNNIIISTDLSQIPAAGGDVFHAMKSTDLGYDGFGEAYFSWVDNKSVKAWKRHKNMTMNLIVPLGTIRFIFFETDLSVYQEKKIGTDNYVRLTVPPGIWFGFQGVGLSNNLLLNIANIPHDPEEVEEKPINFFSFDWNKI